MIKNYIMRINYAVLFCLLCMTCFVGCAHNQYEKVAKEWCTAIRANQMIPVYPLNQDVRPGDVYLVQNTIGQQSVEYDEKGFLTLDDHRTRLPLEPSTYGTMYVDSYFKSEEKPPCDYPILRPQTTEIVQDKETKIPTSLTPAKSPRVAFPSYSFTINRGEGLSLGVPISTIPVALNFLGAQEASAVVTLADASTYQADHEIIMTRLRAWVTDRNVRAELIGACQDVGKDYVFLRVIKRVYLVGSVDVALERNDNIQAGIQAGLAEQASDPNISFDTFTQNINKQSKLLEQLNSIAARTKIGGAVSFNTATQRNIGLRESFDRPLVVGYLGVDVPFFKDGSLGAPIPTFEHLTLPKQFGDPKPIELGKLLVATKLFKIVIGNPETRLQAITAAEWFCKKIGGEKFLSLGNKASELSKILSSGGSLPEKNIKDFTNDLITEINYRSTVGPEKDIMRVKCEKELRSALLDQVI